MASDLPAEQATSSLATERTALRLTVLGEFSVWLGQRLVPEMAFARRKALSLLKVLALRPGYHLHREQVLDILWPDLPADSAGTQLYKAIYHARQAFASVEPPDPPETLLQLHGDVLSLTAPGGVSSDLAGFEALASQALKTRDVDLLHQAAGCYGGDLLPADLYEAWATERRDSLREQFNDLLVELGEVYLASGALAEAADVLRQAVARDAKREDAHRGLMLVYARQGSRARALRQYRRCVEAMQRELDVDVSARTTALYRDILAERVQPTELSSKGPPVSLAILPPLIGRRTELRLVGTVLERLAQGHGTVLGLESDAGVGKTRLAQEILRLGWRRHWHVLFGSAHEQEGQMPYLPFVEAIRGALWLDPVGAELIPAELAVAIPELSASVPVGIPDRLAAQSALFAGVARFLAARARAAPVILILDDLHAFDAGSLKLFAYLARETATMALCLVGSWRSHDPGSSSTLKDTIGDLERRQLLHRLSLTPHSAEEHRDLLAQALGTGSVGPDLAAELYRFSEGNALFAGEMARQLAADGRLVRTEGTWRFATESGSSSSAMSPAIPQSLQTLVRRRLATLSPASVRLIQLAAVVGRDVPLPILEQGVAAEDAARSVLDFVDEALAAGLLTEAGLTVRFPHALLREAIYEHVSQARRAALHGVVAGALENLFAGEPGAMPVESIAYHYRHAGDIGRAVHYLLQAGSRAEKAYDHDGALGRYGEALALLQDGVIHERAHLLAEVHERTGDTYRAVGDVTRSLEAYRQSLASLARDQVLLDRGRRFTLHRKIALGAMVTRDGSLATEHLALARPLVGALPLDEAQLLIAEALFAWYRHEYGTALQAASRALALAERAGARAEIGQAYEMLALSHLPLGHWEEGLRCESERHRDGWSPEHVVSVDAHLCLYLHAFHGAQSLQHTQRFLEGVALQSATAGHQHCLAACHFALGNLALRQGLPNAANDNLARALELHESIGSQAGMAYTLAQQVELLTAAGVYAPATQLIERGVEAAYRAAMRDHCLRQLYAAGIRNRVAAGDVARAAELVEATHLHYATCPPCAVCRVELCEALAAFHVVTGELDQALAYINQAAQLTGYAQSGPGRARLARARGKIHAARGETSEAERYLLEAADHFRAVGAQYDMALTLQALAALDDGQDRTAMRRQAEETFIGYRSLPLAAVTAG